MVIISFFFNIPKALQFLDRLSGNQAPGSENILKQELSEIVV